MTQKTATVWASPLRIMSNVAFAALACLAFVGLGRLLLYIHDAPIREDEAATEMCLEATADVADKLAPQGMIFQEGKMVARPQRVKDSERYVCVTDVKLGSSHQVITKRMTLTVAPKTAPVLNGIENVSAEPAPATP